MNRRKFLKLAGMTCPAVAAPFPHRSVLACAEPYQRPFLSLINAPGRWDPVYLCDPKPMGPPNRLNSA